MDKQLNDPFIRLYDKQIRLVIEESGWEKAEIEREVNRLKEEKANYIRDNYPERNET